MTQDSTKMVIGGVDFLGAHVFRSQIDVANSANNLLYQKIVSF